MNLSNKDIDVNMTAGRGGNGYKAEIGINPKPVQETSVIPSEPIPRKVVDDTVTEEETPVTEDSVEPETESKSLFSS